MHVHVDKCLGVGVVFVRCEPDKIGAKTCYEMNIFDSRPDPSYGTGAIVYIAELTFSRASSRGSERPIWRPAVVLIEMPTPCCPLRHDCGEASGDVRQLSFGEEPAENKVFENIATVQGKRGGGRRRF